MFIKRGWFPLIVKRDQWTQYIEALEKADYGDLRPLVAMFVEAQREALIQATEVAYDVKPIESPHDAIIAVRDRLQQRGRPPHTAWLAAKQTAAQLFQATVQRLGQIADELVRETGGPVATNSDYGRRAASLALSPRPRAELVVAFPPTAVPAFRGFIRVAAHLTLEEQSPIPIKGGTFQINYEETLEAAQARFHPWLDRVITEGLLEWRRTL